MKSPSPLLRRIFSGLPETLDKDSLVNAATIVRPAFDGIVAGLADPAILKLPRINDLCTLTWQLVGSYVTQFALTDMEAVTSLSFLGVVIPGKPMTAAILAPMSTYAARLLSEPWMQLGAVVHAASQARDFWNERLPEGRAVVMRRAAAYEAELLNAIKGEPSFEPNDYQRRVMGSFATGFPSDLDYTSRPFDLRRAMALFKSYSGASIVKPLGPPHLLPKG